MSRSYKKTPKFTDHVRRTTQHKKKLANRLVRKYNKKVVNGYLLADPRYEDEMTLDNNNYKKYYCSYNITDYAIYYTMQEALKDYPFINTKRKYKDRKQFINKHWKKYFYRK